MRSIIHPDLKGRMTESDGQFPNDWRFGQYVVDGSCGVDLIIISSMGYGWEHVSASAPNRTPNWKEMCFVKDLFWSDEETVIQYHPPKVDYINFNPRVLHLWKPAKVKLRWSFLRFFIQPATIPMPPKWMVGPYDGWEKDCPKELQDHARDYKRIADAKKS